MSMIFQRFFLTASLYLFFIFVLQAQSPRKILKEADAHFKYKDYHNAVPLYQEVLRLRPDHPKRLQLLYRLGYSHLYAAHKNEALAPLLEVYTTAPAFSKDLLYLLAQAYHYDNQFDSALVFYQKALATLPKQSKQIQKKMQECQFGKDYLAKPVPARIQNMGSVINSPFPDYVPLISADESVLIFTSRRKGTNGGQKDPQDGLFFEDIYMSLREEGVWTAPSPLPKPINSPSHDACIALSPDGQQLFVYKPGKAGMGDIYVSQRKENNTWTEPLSLGDRINTKHREPSASISADGQTLYFSSDRPGGLGGLDIYKSQRLADGTWGAPENLGPSINTEYDEDSPFVQGMQRLYFSSQGHSSMGGFDIFVSEADAQGQWTAPRNLGYPINTTDDDIYWVVSADGRRGYYASSKKGGFGEKDIYVIQILDNLKEGTE